MPGHAQWWCDLSMDLCLHMQMDVVIETWCMLIERWSGGYMFDSFITCSHHWFSVVLRMCLVSVVWWLLTAECSELGDVSRWPWYCDVWQWCGATWLIRSTRLSSLVVCLLCSADRSCVTLRWSRMTARCRHTVPCWLLPVNSYVNSFSSWQTLGESIDTWSCWTLTNKTRQKCAGC